MALKTSTYKLHAGFIRHLKGLLTVWEEWVRANQEPPTLVNNPDPVKHFQQQSRANERQI